MPGELNEKQIEVPKDVREYDRIMGEAVKALRGHMIAFARRLRELTPVENGGGK